MSLHLHSRQSIEAQLAAALVYLQILMQAPNGMLADDAIRRPIGTEDQHRGLAISSRKAGEGVQRCQVAPMQILENDYPWTISAQCFHKITEFAEHALAGRTEHLALKCGALRRTNQSWYLQHPSWRVGANSCLQFCSVRAATSCHQRVDQGQERFIGSEPLGAAPAQQIDALLRQPVHRHLEKGRFADPGFPG